MRVPFLLLALLLASVLPAPSLQSQDSPAERAEAAMQTAMRIAARGGYEQAVLRYQEIARRYQGTPAGIEAAARSQPNAFLSWADVERHGPSENRLDVVVMGDGYRLGDQDEFDDIARIIPDLFDRHKLLGEYHTYHNFLRANLRSEDQGVTGFGRTENTVLGGYVQGTIAGHVAVDRAKTLRMLGKVPDHDGYTIAIVKAGSMGSGGRGIATIGGRADNTLIHEWGHAFGDLSDEYTEYTHRRPATREGINVSTTDDPEAVPWSHWIDAKVPGIDVYEGADGRLKGAWKPVAGNCAMEGGVIFCPVCREALVLRIHRYVDPIEACEPEPDSRLTDPGPVKFEVTVMKPKTHNLRVSWYVLSGEERIRTTAPGPFRDRRRRGPLRDIPTRPENFLVSARTTQSFTLDTRRMEPGIYQVICRVVDDAKPAGQQFPWVLKDERGLLQSERAWLVEVK